MNTKYEITNESMVFEGVTLYRIKSLKEFHIYGRMVRVGELGGWVESESNLSFKEGDDSWLFDTSMIYSRAKVENNSTVHTNSKVKNRSRVNNSLVNMSVISGSGVVNSLVIASDVTDSQVRNGTVNNSGIVDASVSHGSDVRKSYLKNTEVLCLSLIHGSKIVDAKVSNGGTVLEGCLSKDSDIFTVSGVGSQLRLTTVHRIESGWQVCCGCFKGSIKQFEEAIKVTHITHDSHRKAYLAMVDFIRARIEAYGE